MSSILKFLFEEAMKKNPRLAVAAAILAASPPIFASDSSHSSHSVDTFHPEQVDPRSGSVLNGGDNSIHPIYYNMNCANDRGRLADTECTVTLSYDYGTASTNGVNMRVGSNSAQCVSLKGATSNGISPHAAGISIENGNITYSKNPGDVINECNSAIAAIPELTSVKNPFGDSK